MEYKGNRDGLRALLRSPGVSSELSRRARQVQTAARENAPARSGALRSSIDVVEDVSRDGRARVRVVANKSYASRLDTAWLARSLDAGAG